MKMATPRTTTSLRPFTFAHPLDVDNVPAKGVVLTIEPPASNYATIAIECGLRAVANLRATYRVMPRAGGRFEVTGDVAARVTQICVVSLETFESDVTQGIDLTFAPRSEVLDGWCGTDIPRRGRRNATEHDPRRGRAASPPFGDDPSDPPDPIIDGRINLGAIAMEFLVLALDPHPKKPGVAFDDVVEGDDASELSAFAGLARLKDRM